MKDRKEKQVTLRGGHKREGERKKRSKEGEYG
jgi:hypothetical protein